MYSFSLINVFILKIYSSFKGYILSNWKGNIQLVCDNMGGAQQLLDTPEAFVREMFANLQQATDYLGVVPASAMNRFTQHLRDAVLEQIKSDNIEPSQYENVGAILIFVMNGLSGLLNTDAKLPSFRGAAFSEQLPHRQPAGEDRGAG